MDLAGTLDLTRSQRGHLPEPLVLRLREVGSSEAFHEVISVTGRCRVRFLLHAGSLQLLEQQVVGGEQAKNKDLKEKHKGRKRYADERKKQLVAALQNSDEDSGDWVLLNVYDSIQEEVRAKSKLLEKMQRKVRPSL